MVHGTSDSLGAKPPPKSVRKQTSRGVRASARWRRSLRPCGARDGWKRQSVRILGHTVDVAKQGDTIHIPLSEDRAVALLGRVKPTADMPRPGTHPAKAK